ncbi:uncharacterized protein K441DRAFT_652065 [Cenococcum geophilum 1.58]|uniref:uncharacterized protein n=1 Tax=Cenococcum geophilum 1.58 TaxID=794803 RepID=UPI00358F0FF6|nr:hypothetical protein K441DRAFT_652065 [Cenococcum geophilum 1.58]
MTKPIPSREDPSRSISDQKRKKIPDQQTPDPRPPSHPLGPLKKSPSKQVLPYPNHAASSELKTIPSAPKSLSHATPAR